MKIAIVHDYLCGFGGSERVFQYICEEFPEADAFTLAYNPDTTLPYFSGRGIRTTWMNKFVHGANTFKLAFPVSTYVMESLDLSQYDLVLSSSATVAKYLNVPNGVHVCYCYIPTRAIWHFEEYFGSGFKGRVFKFLLPWLKARDCNAAQRVNHFIAISEATRKYIGEYYGRESEVVYSPIDLDKFFPSEKKKEHYLIVSRLEYWKRVDYAIEAFNKMGLPLRIIGGGEEELRLKGIAKSNITFLGVVDDVVLAREYADAKAVIFTPFLEYGLIPLEANASGTPVICLGKGGITETMVPWVDGAENTATPTAVFFYEQTADALVSAVRQFEQASFDSEKLVKHASRWGVPEFRRQLRETITRLGAGR